MSSTVLRRCASHVREVSDSLAFPVFISILEASKVDNSLFRCCEDNEDTGNAMASGKLHTNASEEYNIGDLHGQRFRLDELSACFILLQ